MTGGKPKLRKSYRAALGAAEDEAAKAGATMSYDLTGRHPSFTITLDGQTRRSIFASTPRCADGQPNWLRQRVRQMVREIARDSGSGPTGRRPERAPGEAPQSGGEAASPNHERSNHG